MRLKPIHRAVSFAMAAAMMLGMSLSAFAETYHIDTGSITITATEDGGRSVTQENGVTDHVETEETVVTQENKDTATTNTITVTDDGDGDKDKVEFTLDGVNMKTEKGGAAVEVGKDTETTIVVSGENKITDGTVHLEDGGSLTIRDDEANPSDEADTLVVTGKDRNSAAAIGSASGEALSGSLTITGNVSVDAETGAYIKNSDKTISGGTGAGIGTGNGGELSGSIVIDSSGTVEGKSTAYGAGIGTGNEGELSGSISISGDGTVKGNCDDKSAAGAGIGTGKNGQMTSSGSISISGGDVTGEGYFGAGIGTGYGAQLDGTVSVSGGTVTAQSDFAAGLGTGYGADLSGSIEISGGTVTGGDANGYGYGAGVGTGFMGSMTDNASISISGGEVNASAKLGAGVGTGYAGGVKDNASISVSGGEVNASAQTGAGVGTGYTGSMTGSSSISVSGGEVNATAQAGAAVGTGGTGSMKDSASISISGGTVAAENTSTSAANAGAAVGTGSSGKISAGAAIEISGDGTSVTAKAAQNTAANIGTGYKGTTEGTIAILDSASVKLEGGDAYIGSGATSKTNKKKYMDGEGAVYAVSSDAAITTQSSDNEEEEKVENTSTSLAENVFQTINDSGSHVHIMEVDSAAVEPTCGEAGQTRGLKCADDDYAIQPQTIDPTGEHTAVADAAVEPTCTATGLTEGSHCSVCGEILVAQTTIPATGVHQWNEGVVTTPATCTAEGVLTYTCASGGETKTEAIAKTEHTPVSDNNAVAATCTSEGKTASTSCSVCGEVLEAQTTVAATGHQWGEGVVTTPATCTAEGVLTYTCATCGETKTEAIAKTEHTPVSDNNAVAATCTSEGKTASTSCSVCGEVLEAQTTVAATGVHQWGEGVVTTPATCTAEGVLTYTCATCGETKTEAIAKTAHNPVAMEEIAATTTSEGRTGGTQCAVCGEILTQPTVLPALTPETNDDGDETATTSAAEAAVAALDFSAYNSVTSTAQSHVGEHHEDEAVRCEATLSNKSVTVVAVEEKLTLETTKFVGTVAQLETLDKAGVETITFVSCGVSYTFNLNDLLRVCKGTAYTITYENGVAVLRTDAGDVIYGTLA